MCESLDTEDGVLVNDFTEDEDGEFVVVVVADDANDAADQSKGGGSRAARAAACADGPPPDAIIQLEAEAVAAEAASGATRERRRGLAARAAALAARAVALRDRCGARRAAEAAERKAEGNSLYKARDWAGAAALYSEAVELDPYNPTYLTNRSLARQSAGDWAAAAADGRAALALDVNCAQAYICVATSLLASGGPEAAVACLASAPRALLAEGAGLRGCCGRVADDLKDAGNRRFEARDHTGVAALYRRSRELAPGWAVFLSNHSAALQALGRWREALADAEAAASLEPHVAKYHIHVGRSLRGLGRPGDGSAALGVALAQVERRGAAVRGQPPPPPPLSSLAITQALLAWWQLGCAR